MLIVVKLIIPGLEASSRLKSHIRILGNEAEVSPYYKVPNDGVVRTLLADFGSREVAIE